MPRGGRRPGAGARKGNTNAMRSMNYSLHARLVYERMIAHPDLRELGEVLIANGLSLPRKFTAEDNRRALQILYAHFFDRSAAIQSTTIKHNQPTAPRTPSSPPNDEDPHP